MTVIQTTRPRDINYWRAAGILYGDLGTSKAYVLGLAFALAGHASFWFILAVSILTLLVGINYIYICKFYPSGGGVYASVRDRSHVLSVIGAFFLISDYLVTAALSALSAFHYLGVFHPEIWAILAILMIGLLNFLGPKQTGGLAIAIAIPTVICIIFLGIIVLPFLPEAIQQLNPINYNLRKDWNVFVGIIVALSGIEAIANTTSSMKLDQGCTQKKPSVFQTSTPAIIMVIIEVCFFTALLGLAMNALPDLEVVGDQVNAPNFPDVRDAMLRYMGEFFGGTLFGPIFGRIFGIIISIVITLLLLSAVNTAMIALSSLLFVMSRDKEMPLFFQKLNRFGVPVYAVAVAFLAPIAILSIISDIAGLANLYAIGFVGAIAVNLGATATNKKLPFNLGQRIFMFGTCIIMALIEITLFIDKPHARNFVIAIIGVGLLLRAIAIEKKEKKISAPSKPEKILNPIPEHVESNWLVAVTGVNKALEYALQESKMYNMPLYVLFIREQKVITEYDQQRTWLDDPEARTVYEYIASKEPKNPIEFLYTISGHIAQTIGEVAREKKVNKVIVGRARKASYLLSVLRGTTVQNIARSIPDRVEFDVIY